jgi:alkylation response protein AidB-like acyl-CoA dehydrogenase
MGIKTSAENGGAESSFTSTIIVIEQLAKVNPSEGKNLTTEVAMAKYWSSVAAQRVSGQAIKWAGGVGFTRETGIEKFRRASNIMGFYGSCSVKLAILPFLS